MYKLIVWALGQSVVLLGILAGVLLPVWVEGRLPRPGDHRAVAEAARELAWEVRQLRHELDVH